MDPTFRIFDFSVYNEKPSSMEDCGSDDENTNYKDNNIVYVERGRDGTSIGNHLRGAEVKSITSNDNKLIPIGDDFGFDGDLT